MKTVSIFEGKNKLSELVTNAAAGEPQVITKNGVETAVVISYREFRRLNAQQESLVDFLLNSPLRGANLDLERNRDTGRETLDFS